MLFNTLQYALFFGLCFFLSWAVARVAQGWVRIVFLLAASYAFYAHWDWRYLPLVFGSSTVDFWLARVIHKAEGSAKKRLLAVTVVLNLGLLAVFKYWNFFLEGVRALHGALGGDGALDPGLTVALPPVGISFFTFVSMSYVFDVYRGIIQPHRSYLRYLLFVSFFPHLVAGPIVRGRDLLPQLERPPRLTRAEAGEALYLVAIGLLKKVVVADQLAVNLVDRVFASPENYSALEVLVGVYAYAMQIYCDFSGYTDIAIGSALLLGVRFPDNFDAPYKAASLSEFWRRWHMSLSSWLRDYLYIPLGGSRNGSAATYRNLLITMLLGGLWHGPAWTFVFWGLLHGVGLAVARALERRRGPQSEEPRGLRRALGMVATFHWVCLAWVFFRAPDFGKAFQVLGRLATGTLQHANLPPLLLALLAATFLAHLWPTKGSLRLRETFIRLPSPAQGVALFVVAVVLHEAASAEAVPFIYFQF